MTGRLGVVGAGLVAAGVILLGVAGLVAQDPSLSRVSGPGWTTTNGRGGMMGAGPGYGGMMGAGSGYGGMMGGAWSGASAPGPGEDGFVAGTLEAPRVVRIAANANLRFTPDTVRVRAGETIRFEVTVMGPVIHEFMVGPAADVAVDREGTPEVADLSMMETGTIMYTFSGPGPFAFACHATGHYEAGMTGTIVVDD